ncbi:MAG: septum formation initiator family protein [Actinomycetota bacterium]|nr:septum formation initiator family protein [Actinomycetota bacterium]
MASRIRRPRHAVTGRTLVLGAVVVLLVVLLASPLNRFFGSRGDVSTAAQQLRQDRQRLAELQKQEAQWSDPGYIQQQARRRLQYAMPGDTVYAVVDHGQQNQIDASVGGSSTQVSPPSWNGKLWDSVRRADAAP